MSDPYSILGVDRNATDEDVKRAYRKLSRQYHPDANINNPKKDEAEAKFKEVQQAYQQIMDEREKGYTSGYGSSDGSDYWRITTRLEDSAVLVLMDMVQQEVRGELPG